MSKRSTFHLHQYHDHASGLLQRLRKALGESADETVRNLQTELPSTLAPDEAKPLLTIAFVGQYNAGKSTLLKGITQQENIAIDGDVCTDQVAAYDWNGVRLLDTPGVRAGTVDHDALTEAQIAKSDLLIFVITGELFGDVIGTYFRDLAFEKRRSSEMMLVINKMDQDPGSEETKRPDIELVTAPLSMEDLQSVFCSGELYLEGLEEEDQEMRGLLLEKSNMSALMEGLNTFARENGFLASLTTPLFTLRAVASQAAGLCDVDQPEARIALELLSRRSRIVRESRARLSGVVSGLLQQALTDLSALGDAAAGNIAPDKSEAELERAIKESEEKAKARVEKLKEALESAIEEEKGLLEEEANQLSKSPLASQLDELVTQSQASLSSGEGDSAWQFDSPSQTATNSDAEKAARMRKIGDVVGKISNWTVGVTKGSRAVSGWGPVAAAGSQAHNIIYNVGKFFGHSFKPWEAAGMAAKFGAVGKVLGPIASILQVAGQVAEEKLEEKEHQQLLQARSETRARYWDSANEVRDQFSTQFDAFLDDFYGPILAETDELMVNMNTASSQRSGEAVVFKELSDELLDLIETIQGT